MNQETKTRVLIVDDDKEIRDLLAKFLSDHSFDVAIAQDGERMQKVMDGQEFDIIILDVMMPGDDGFALCRKIRSESKVPVIMLTAVTEETDRIIGLELGADDYLTKPFNPRELLARMKAVLRRSQQAQDDTSVIKGSKAKLIYEFAGWILDKNARRLVSPDNVEISLSTGEYDLLLALIENPQQVLSRDELLDTTRNRAAGPFDRSIDVQISRLRQKIEEEPKKPVLIKTVRGGGYVFTAHVEIRSEE